MSSMGSLPIQIVDEQDRPVRTATKQEAWQQGLLHRIVRIMLENSRGEILLHKRAPGKDIFPNCWDNSAAGHVDAGEDYDQAAYRELKEEIGIEGQPLTVMGSYRSRETHNGRIFNRFNRVYKLQADETPSRLEAGKVAEVRWFTPPEVKALVSEHPDQVSDGLRQVVERYY